MKPADIIIIAVLALIVGAVVFYLIKNRKKGGCASCPYSKGCPNCNRERCEACEKDRKDTDKGARNGK